MFELKEIYCVLYDMLAIPGKLGQLGGGGGGRGTMISDI